MGFGRLIQERIYKYMICQILGLTGIDLFSPSDVVEKRDIRRVCMCIRSLSKKARSKKLNVPDFDIVTHNIAMPTHLVGGIRRNLELSRCIHSSFSASSPWNDAREICRLKIPYGHHSQHSDSRSVESESYFSDIDSVIPGNEGNSPSEIKSSSILDLSSTDNYSCDSELEGSSCTLASKNGYSFFSSLADKQNKFSRSSIHPPDRKQNELAHSEMVVEGNFSKEPCERYNFQMPKSEGKNKLSKCALELFENHGSSSNYTQDKDHCCICGSMVDGSSFSGLQRMVSTISERQRSPEKEDSVEHTDGLYYDGIFSADDLDCSDELKMHQSSHNVSDIVLLLSDYESKIPISKKGPEMTVVDKKLSVNPENCQYDDENMRDFGHQMKKLNSFCAKDFEVLDVMETEGESFQTVHIPPSSTSDCREQKEVVSDGSIEVEKHVVSYIHDTFAESNNAPQAKLDHTKFQKDIKPDECGKSKSREGRTVGNTRNQILKSVAEVMTMVGAFVLLLHVRQKNDKEINNETWMPFQIQKPNREFFTARKIKIGKSGSLYPGEKLKF